MKTCLVLIVGFIAAVPAAAQVHGVAADVLSFEDARFAAMVSADTSVLARMLAEDLVYVHSTGHLETKAEFLNAIGSRTLQYLTFTPEERRVMVLDSSCVVVVGRIKGKVVSGNREVDLDARYVAVNHHDGERWKLRAWESTRIQP